VALSLAILAALLKMLCRIVTWDFVFPQLCLPGAHATGLIPDALRAWTVEIKAGSEGIFSVIRYLLKRIR
jgi:hypothetical protein